MEKIKIISSRERYVTVPALWMDTCMTQASGEFVKVFLILLKAEQFGEALSICDIADKLNLTEKDVLRAFTYWEKQGLLLLERDGEEIAGIRMMPEGGSQPSGTDAPAAAQAGMSAAVQTVLSPAKRSARPAKEDAADPALQSKAPAKPAAQTKMPAAAGGEEAEQQAPARRTGLMEVAEDETFRQLMFVAQQYMGKTLNRTDTDRLAYLYGELGMEAEVLEYLLEYCVSTGHRSTSYMEKVALDWHAHGIMTAEDAKLYTPIIRREAYAVMKALGLGSRRPAPEEKELIDKWFTQDGFTLEMVEEACRRTIRKVHQPSFEYCNGILESWKKQGAATMEAVQALDASHRDAAGKGRSEGAAATSGRRSGRGEKNRPGSFDSFAQRRDFDYDALTEELSGASAGSASGDA